MSSGIVVEKQELTLQNQDPQSGNATYVDQHGGMILTLQFNEGGFAIKAPSEMTVVVVFNEGGNPDEQDDRDLEFEKELSGEWG